MVLVGRDRRSAARVRVRRDRGHRLSETSVRPGLDSDSGGDAEADSAGRGARAHRCRRLTGASEEQARERGGGLPQRPASTPLPRVGTTLERSVSPRGTAEHSAPGLRETQIGPTVSGAFCGVDLPRHYAARPEKKQEVGDPRDLRRDGPVPAGHDSPVPVLDQLLALQLLSPADLAE
jgi:hypothetical protein